MTDNDRPAKKATTYTTTEFWEALARPFPHDDIERLPKLLDRNDNQKGRCRADGNSAQRVSADGHYCGGWHARSVHLSYVGHAGITTRLNEVCTPAGWTYEPFALTPEGLPHMTRDFYWAKLTVVGPDGEPVTKSDFAANFDTPQEAYGDALRRCAMRFGIGTYLWSKSDSALLLAQANDDATPTAPPAAPPEPMPTTEALLDRLDALAAGQGTDREGITAKWRERNGGIGMDALSILAPMTLLPLVESIESYIAAQQPA